MDDEPTVTEVEFSFGEGDFFLVEASERAECEFELELVVPRSDGAVLEYFTARGADPDRILELLDGARDVQETRLLERDGDEARFELVTDGQLAKTLADQGTPVTQITARAGEGRLIAEVPAHILPRPAIEGFQAEYPNAELIAIRETNRRAPMLTQDQFISGLLEALTEKQIRVLRLAYASGYFSWPRATSAEDIAAELGISTPTFSEHLRAAHRNLLSAIFQR